MILSVFFRQVNSAYRGTDDDAPTVGTTDYQLWLDTTNRKISEWATTGKITWESLFEIREVGTILEGVQAYELDSDLLQPSDTISILTTNGTTLEYTINKPQERDLTVRSVYLSGRDPKVLNFYDTIDADSAITGGTASIGGYFIPNDLTKDKDVIPVDDPYWLVYAVAYELAFNDITYESKASDLNNKANDRWSTMVSNNRRGTGHNPRRARTAVRRIMGTRGGY